MFDILVVTIVIIILLGIFSFVKTPSNLPPGPRCLPLIGNTVLFKPRAHEALTKIGQKYGSIFRIYIGTNLAVVLNDYEVIKEALDKQGHNFTGRPTAFIMDWFHNKKGIAFSSGKHWKEQRRFALHTLNNFGFGRASLENRIMVEVQNVLEVIGSHNGKPFALDRLLEKAVCNVVCSLAFDKRFEYDDKQLEQLLENMDIMFENFGLLNPVNFFPPYRFVSNSFAKFKKAVAKEQLFLNKIIDEHLVNYQPDNLRDFIDVFIRRMKDEEDLPETEFNRNSLLMDIEDLFNGGTETASTTLLWGIMLFLHYPEIQAKVQKELHVIIGSSRPVSLSDRPFLPYTEATIYEFQRYASILPFALFHKADTDAMIYNYFIPKNTVIIPNVWNVHHDPKYWPNPEEFKPERFLGEDGKINKNIKGFLPFSVGKRACIAESLAKNELFLFTANILQRFELSIPVGHQPPDLNNYTEGVTLRPQPFYFSAKSR